MSIYLEDTVTRHTTTRFYISSIMYLYMNVASLSLNSVILKLLLTEFKKKYLREGQGCNEINPKEIAQIS